MRGFEPVSGEGAGDRQELVSLLWRAARLGSVVAMKTLLAEAERSPEEPPPRSVIDELGRRRGGET